MVETKRSSSKKTTTEDKANDKPIRGYQRVNMVEKERLCSKRQNIDFENDAVYIVGPTGDSCEKQTKAVPGTSISEQIPFSSIANQFEDKSKKHSSVSPPKNQVPEELVETVKSVTMETMPTVPDVIVTRQLDRPILLPNNIEELELLTNASENFVVISKGKDEKCLQTKSMEKVTVDEIQSQYSEPQSNSVYETSLSETIIHNNKMPDSEVDKINFSSDVYISPQSNVCDVQPKHFSEEQRNNGLAMVSEVNSTEFIGNWNERSAEELVASNNQSHLVSYMFNFPTEMVGKLIGRGGRNINELMERSGCKIYVKGNHDPSPDLSLICINGSEQKVDCALDQIHQQFPPHKLGELDFSEALSEQPMPAPEIMQLSLPEEELFDAKVSSVVIPNQIFLQQPTCPSFSELDKQSKDMNSVYADSLVPVLPTPIEVGMICVAPMVGGWYRAIVVAVNETENVRIKYLDYGGYVSIDSQLLRRIRSDFTSMPIQGVECYLANVFPPEGMDTFPAEANAILEQIVRFQLMKAEVAGYNEWDGIPYVNLFQTLPDGSLKSVNRQLVDLGVARWLEHAEPTLYYE